MLCKVCGKKAEGKFCSNCGSPLEEISSMKEEAHLEDTGEKILPGKYRAVDTEKNTVTNTYRRKNKTKKKSNGKVSSAVSQSASKAGSAAGKGIRFLWNLLFALVHGICGICMVAIAGVLFLHLWAGRENLGSITQMVHERNYPLAVFLGGAVCLVGFALLEALWISSSKKVMDMGIVCNLDTGRGLFGFCLYLALSLGAGVVLRFLPESHEIFEGIRLLFLCIKEVEQTIMILAIAGILLCLVRKMRGSVNGVLKANVHEKRS